ncbi:uncharacterized protein N7483_002470 [Penicillium malachiteum]|uniref:uncharacterized protein n=1 Tax=Penicillium malachiteum TaxID=1324776 RepID=UPI002546F68A|nr:uncharacterized protein N7483_002470 [Penicillium malachiteum]KAJ5737345.1 hypothetical protein N7483_002470 [Penicillium malachiteum]
MSSKTEPNHPPDKVCKRVRTACDWCRLKKCKCDGASPCSTCRAGDKICVFGQRKVAHNRAPYPKGYVEMLEQQQAWLVHGLQELYCRSKKGEDLTGDRLELQPNGHPLTHDLLTHLGALDPTKDETFEVNPGNMQHKLRRHAMQSQESIDTSSEPWEAVEDQKIDSGDREERQAQQSTWNPPFRGIKDRNDMQIPGHFLTTPLLPHTQLQPYWDNTSQPEYHQTSSQWKNRLCEGNRDFNRNIGSFLGPLYVPPFTLDNEIRSDSQNTLIRIGSTIIPRSPEDHDLEEFQHTSDSYVHHYPEYRWSEILSQRLQGQFGPPLDNTSLYQNDSSIAPSILSTGVGQSSDQRSTYIQRNTRHNKEQRQK